MVWLSLIITILYLSLIIGFVVGYTKITDFKPILSSNSKTKFSVIIPFRNEAKNLTNLLQSLAHLAYPSGLFEIILVNDGSEDDSVNIITNFIQQSNLDLSVIDSIRQSKSPKKDAISTAIKKAKYEWIITTDADCEFNKYWLNSFDEIINSVDTKCIAGPVNYYNRPHFLNKFQILDLLSLQGATIGSFGFNKPFLCNGANFAYKKQLFTELNGFNGNDETSSGDDIFLLEKIASKYPNNLVYLKCKHAIVHTHAQDTWHLLIQQRVRWAAKTSRYNNSFGKATGLIVFLMNTLLISILFLTLLDHYPLYIFIIIVLAKWMIDFIIISKTAAFLNQKQVLKAFPLASIIYPFFSVHVAVKSLFSDYTWKGRQFKK